jgi:hypothetical protein
MRVAVFAVFMFFSACLVRAQTNYEKYAPPEAVSFTISSGILEPAELPLGHLPALSLDHSEGREREDRSHLPDMPQPKQDNRTRDFHAPFHLDETDRSWGRAMRHAPVLTVAGLLTALTVIQLIKTDRCINENKPVCNLISGKNRAAAYGVDIPLTAGVVYLVARMKEKGNVTGFFLVSVLSFTYEATVTYTANPHVLVCQAGRTPQCQ